MTKNTEHQFSTHVFLHMLEELDTNLSLTESDIRHNETITGCANLCIAAVTRLEYVLQTFLVLCASMRQQHLDALMQLYSQILLQHCLKVCSGSLPQLYDRMSNHEQHFDQFFTQRYPGKPLPPPEEEGPFYTPEIVSKYQVLLQNNPLEEDWPWVSRKHLRLCMYMLEELRQALNALIEGKLPAEACTKLQPEKRELPAELSTPKALRVLEKLRKGGLLDEEYMPAEKLSLTKKAVMAQKISDVVWGENRWKCFNDYWAISRLSSHFAKGCAQAQMSTFIESVNRCLSD